MTSTKTKKLVLSFYNYFLKIELTCDKENHVNFEYMQFPKDIVQVNMCSDLLIEIMCS